MNATSNPPHERIRLTGTPVGRMVRITDFGDETTRCSASSSTPYGLSAAHAVKVLQQTPMTVLLCEHVELAIEHAVARHLGRAGETATRPLRALLC